ncbi:MAG: hypothetical protein J6Z38_02700, partial [Lachnospiraceae bacterium]|nr:hypothetical protein [Lachnospiraceae bacterium]
MNEPFTLKKVMLQETETLQEYYVEVTNDSEGPAFLPSVTLYETKDLKDLGLDAKHCRVYRSGRQKNDMPSVFTLGVRDDAMEDALGGLSESGAVRAVAETADY